MANADEMRSKALDTLQLVSTIITVIAPLSLIFSLAYEVGFYQGLRLDVEQISLTIADLTILVVTWIPFTLLLAAVVFFTYAFDVNSTEVISENKTLLQKIWHFVWTKIYLANFLLYVLFGDIFLLGVGAGLIGLFADVINFISRHVARLGWVNSFTLFWLRIISIALLCTYYLGFNQALIRDVAPENINKRGSYIELDNGKSIRGVIIRSYERGFVVETPDVIYLPRATVKKIRYSSAASKVGIICYWWNVACPKAGNSDKNAT